MTKIRITKQFTFEMAHVLKNYDGPCRNVHGHSYELFVTLSGEPLQDKNSPKYGMVMDYRDLKSIVKENIINKYDHSLVLSSAHDTDSINNLKKEFEKVIVVDYQPTNENLIIDIAEALKRLLPETVQLHNLKLRETATAYSEWFSEDNQ